MLEARAAKGEPTKLVDDRPVVCSLAAPFLEAFLELDGQRMVSGLGGASEIFRASVTDWLDENGIEDPMERAEYRRYIRLLDAERLKIMAEKADKTAPPKGRVN